MHDAGNLVGAERAVAVVVVQREGEAQPVLGRTAPQGLDAPHELAHAHGAVTVGAEVLEQAPREVVTGEPQGGPQRRRVEAAYGVARRQGGQGVGGSGRSAHAGAQRGV